MLISDLPHAATPIPVPTALGRGGESQMKTCGVGWVEPQWEACGSEMKDVKPGHGKGCEEAHSQGQVGVDPASLAVDVLGGTKGFGESSGLILRHLTSQPAAHERRGSMCVCRGARTPEISAVCG